MKFFRTIAGTNSPINKQAFGYAASLTAALNKAARDYSVGDTVTVYEFTVKPVKKVKIKRVVEAISLGKAKKAKK